MSQKAPRGEFVGWHGERWDSGLARRSSIRTTSNSFSYRAHLQQSNILAITFTGTSEGVTSNWSISWSVWLPQQVGDYNIQLKCVSLSACDPFSFEAKWPIGLRPERHLIPEEHEQTSGIVHAAHHYYHHQTLRTLALNLKLKTLSLDMRVWWVLSWDYV